MRCPSCLSYIPEGLPSPVTCPLCGKSADARSQTAAQPSSVAAPTESPSSDQQESMATDQRTLADGRRITHPMVAEAEETFRSQKTSGFAPFFTIKTRLGFGLSKTKLEPSEGSLSFGPEGFSIVYSNGRGWEKVFYRDLTIPQIKGDSVLLQVRGIESKLTLFHPWLPKWMRWPRRKRAVSFIELLNRIQSGLTPYEIAMYQRRLS